MKKESSHAASSLTLVPMGRVPSDLLAWLQERLAAELHRPVTIGKPLGPPPESYQALRGQYLSDTLLAAMRRLPLPAGAQAVGLVEGDCYTPGLNFVFGQAARGGRLALVALPRLRPSFYGEPDNVDLFRERVLKEVIHELGHTWNLPHCPDVHCVMHFSNELRDTDLKGWAFCARCEKRLGWSTRS